MTFVASLYSLVVTLGLRWAQMRALEGPIFGYVSGLGRLEHGILEARMIGGGYICVPDTHAEALDDFCSLLVFVGGDFGTEMGSNNGD